MLTTSFRISLILIFRIVPEGAIILLTEMKSVFSKSQEAKP
jgi:hypothetical protein